MSDPVLIIHGEGDPRPVWATEPLVNAIRRVRRIVLPGVGHVPSLERPEPFEFALRAFGGGCKRDTHRCSTELASFFRYNILMSSGLPKILLQLSALGLLSLAAACTRAEKVVATPTQVALPTVSAPSPSPDPTDSEAVVIAEAGAYVIEVSTRKLWKVGGQFTSVHWLPQGDVVVSVTCCDETAGIEVVDLTSDFTNRIFNEEARRVSLSPDGKQIAFTRPRPYAPGSLKTVGLYVLDISGSNLRRLDDTTEISDIRWSPKGDHIAFQAPIQGNIKLFKLASSETMEIGSLERPISFAWSPDGESIAVAGSNGLFLYTISTETTKQFPSGNSVGGVFLNWSSDGTKLLRGDRISGLDRLRLYSIHLASAQEEAVAHVYSESSWSPDGGQIAYVSDGCETGSWDVYSVDADSKAEKRLTTPQSAPRPSNVIADALWSPDGSAVGFSTIDKIMTVHPLSLQTRSLAMRHPQLDGRPIGIRRLVTRWPLHLVQRCPRSRRM